MEFHGSLINIIEEQRQHILLQQNKISMQKNQNWEQRKQNCMLQRRIQQLLLRYGVNNIQSPNKRDEITPGVNGSTKPIKSHSLIQSNGIPNYANDIQKFN